MMQLVSKQGQPTIYDIHVFRTLTIYFNNGMGLGMSKGSCLGGGGLGDGGDIRVQGWLARAVMLIGIKTWLNFVRKAP